MARRIVICLALVASLALLLVADAGARVHRLHPQPKLHKSSVSAPKIKSISPMKANVGQKLTIVGRYFKHGKTTVFFYRQGGGVVSVKPEYSTKKRLVVTIPEKLTPLLRSTALRTRFQIRLLTSRYGKFTKLGDSPLIGAASTDTPGGGGGGPAGPGEGDCDHDGVKNKDETDDDNDLISDSVEGTKTHTDPCKSDTDGDGVTDGYEWQSAKDLNNTTPFNVPDAALPYPGKKPWPNPLDPQDTGIDYDGDGLTMADEYKLFQFYGNNTLPLSYSDGKQRSVIAPAPASLALDYIDMDGDGSLSDDERDGDSDGLGNWDEKYGRMTQDWWDAEMTGQHGQKKESRYPADFPETSHVDPDTDGDGVNDGADDQDHDGLSNSFEISRPWDWQYTYVSGRWAPFSHNGPEDVDYQDAPDPAGPVPVGVVANPWARVQPYNPCKPVWSETCHLHPDFGYYPDDEDWQGPDSSYLGDAPTAPWLFDANDYPISGGE
jgi:hypothetical protein